MLISDYVEVHEASRSWMSQCEVEEPEGCKDGAPSKQERLGALCALWGTSECREHEAVDFVGLLPRPGWSVTAYCSSSWAVPLAEMHPSMASNNTWRIRQVPSLSLWRTNADYVVLNRVRFKRSGKRRRWRGTKQDQFSIIGGRTSLNLCIVNGSVATTAKETARSQSAGALCG